MKIDIWNQMPKSWEFPLKTVCVLLLYSIVLKLVVFGGWLDSIIRICGYSYVFSLFRKWFILKEPKKAKNYTPKGEK